MIATKSPCTISNAAHERVRELECRQIVTQIFDHVIETIAGVLRIELNIDVHDVQRHQVLFVDIFFSSATFLERREHERMLLNWAHATFGPDTAPHFCFSSISEGGDED